MLSAARPRAKHKRCAVFTLHVGNTHTKLIGWQDRGAPDWLAWKTDGPPPRDLAAIFEAHGTHAAPVVLCGVVPEYKETLAALLFKLGREARVFRKDLTPRIDIVPRPPERVGDDRIAGALGALALDATRPWVIVDVGTAMTINAVTPARGTRPPRFEGGLIVPGTMASLLALSEFTAQLPLLERLPVTGWPHSTFIGRSTKEAMLLGVYKAQIAAAVALAKGQMRELGPRARVALTGGGASDAGFLIEFLEAFPPGKVIPYAELIHLGLYTVWKAAQRNTL